MRVVALLAAMVMAAGCARAQPAAPGWRIAWTLGGLADPESVAPSPDGKLLYIANVNGESDAVDGNGFISRASADGKLLERSWVSGLDAPKGVVVAGDRLYVSDITRLVEIDRNSGRILARHEAPGAKFLNDVAVLPDGTVVVSDSQTARIYALSGGKMSVWAQGPLLTGANGILPEPSRMLMVTMQGRLLAFDYATRQPKVLAEGLGLGDGLAPAGGGAYYVSEWPGRLYRVGGDGKAVTLIDSRKAETYINDFVRLGDLLLVPHMKPGEIVAYRLR
jgi:DNA-binding beta-propeller fold protein YncE